jgi:SAM-dependent methyltransferase
MKSFLIKSRTKLLDVGCGTGHILQKISEKMSFEDVSLVGLDLSEAMVTIAKKNTSNSSNIVIVRGDGFAIPFPDLTFDVVINRLADCSLEEVHRVLKVDGYFIKFGTGPKDCLEIADFFGDRYAEKKGPLTGWKEKEIKKHEKVGFIGLELNDFDMIDYYPKEDLIDVIEFVPLVKDFDRKKDGKTIDEIEKRYDTKRGIAITRQFFILKGRK